MGYSLIKKSVSVVKSPLLKKHLLTDTVSVSKVYELQTTPVSLRIDKCLSDPEDTISITTQTIYTQVTRQRHVG